MNSKQIIDMHAHVYKEKIAQKASNAIGTFYGMPSACGGTTAELLERGAQAGIGRHLISSVATTPEQVCKINDFLRGEVEAHPELIGFATLHPFMEHMEEELDRIEALGLKGIKIHPDFQEFYADAPEAMAMYRKMNGRFPILIHVGDRSRDWSAPERVARAADAFPEITWIAAHLGGYSVWGKAHCLYGRPNVYLDTSSSLPFLSPEAAVELIRAHGTDRIFFGTDYPLWDPVEERKRFDTLPLTEDERERILYRNAEAFIR